MSDEVFNDSASDVAVADEGSSDSGYDIQDRMSSGIDDDYWYSSSEGAVVDKDGETIVNEKTGKPFKSIDELKAYAAEQEKQSTAQPKTDVNQSKSQQPEKFMSKGFDNYVFPDGKNNPEAIYKQFQHSDSYKYNDELVPVIDVGLKAEEDASPKLTPIQEVENRRQTMEQHLVQPIIEIRDSLVQNGMSVEQANNAVSGIYQKQMNLIEQDYKEQQQEALKRMVKEETAPVTTLAQEKELKAKSEANVVNLANQYFPNGGKDAFLSLINGYNDENGKFVRGPASPLLDMMVRMAAGDKKFSNQEELGKFYADTFTRATADPVTAKAIINMANLMWLGGKIKDIHGAGKKAGISEAKQASKTFKTKPSIYQQSSQVSDDDGEKVPEMLKALGIR